MSAPTKITVSSSDNTATIAFPTQSWKYRIINLSSHNTKSQQIVSVKVDNESEKVYRITDGEYDYLELPQTAKKVFFTFSYEADGESKTSKLETGGPFKFGAVDMVWIGAENGDDEDYKDVVISGTFK